MSTPQPNSGTKGRLMGELPPLSRSDMNSLDKMDDDESNSNLLGDMSFMPAGMGKGNGRARKKKSSPKKKPLPVAVAPPDVTVEPAAFTSPIKPVAVASAKKPTSSSSYKDVLPVQPDPEPASIFNVNVHRRNTTNENVVDGSGSGSGSGSGRVESVESDRKRIINGSKDEKQMTMVRGVVHSILQKQKPHPSAAVDGGDAVPMDLLIEQKQKQGDSDDGVRAALERQRQQADRFAAPPAAADGVDDEIQEPPPNPNPIVPDFWNEASALNGGPKEDESSSIFAAMEGDSPQAVALRAAMENNEVGVSGLQVERWQKLQGTVIHDAKDGELPAMRPALALSQIVRGSTVGGLQLGVLDIIHRKPQMRNAPHELWMTGVTKNGNSVSIQLTGFQPSFHVLVKNAWSISQCREFGEQINKMAFEVYGGSAANSNSSSGKKQQFPVVVTKVLPERRTPLIGFTGMEEHHLLRVSICNYSKLKTVVQQIESLGMRCVHHDWGLDQQFIHQTVAKRSPTDRHKDVVYESGVRIGRWINIPRQALKPVTSNKRTTSQFEARVEWTQVRRIKCEDRIPILSQAWDIEAISQEGFDLKLPKFPDAANRRDHCISISSAFYIPGYSTRGPFLRLVFSLKPDILPIPNTLVYSFSSEQRMLSAFKRTSVDLCDVDNITGYNSLNFDMPYVFKRAFCIYKDQSFVYWNRFLKDKCWVPKAWINTGSNSGSNSGNKKASERIDFIGRWQVDLHPIASKMENLDNYRLKTVCDAMLKSGANKVELPIPKIAPYFHEGTPERLAQISFYCLVDSMLVWMLDSNRFLLSSSMEISTLTNTSLMDVIKRGEQIRVYNCILEDIHHYQWYINKYIMTESHCYREKVPEDWDGWSENNHLHQFLADKRDKGLIEPDAGYVRGDPRAARRDRLWKNTLCQNFMAGRGLPSSTREGDLPPEQQKELNEFCDRIMYGAKKNKAVKGIAGGKRKCTSDTMKQTTLFGAAAPVASSSNKMKKTAVVSNKPSEGGDDDVVVVDVDDDDDDDDDIDDDDIDDDGDGDVDVDDDDDGDDDGEYKKRKKKKSTYVENVAGRVEKNVELPLGHKRRGRRWFPGSRTLARDESSGGLVFRSLRGIWHRFVSILDFASLYPSIIMSDDVDYSTLVWEEKYMNLEGYSYRRIAHEGYWYYLAIADPEKLTATQHKKATKAGSKIPTPQLRTLMPRILRRFVTARRAVKTEAKEAKDAGNFFLAKVLDCIQLALKVVCNASYGFLNTPEKIAYLSCSPLAYYICSSGRDSIRIVKYFTEVVCGGIVVYGDTDSVMGTFPDMKYVVVPGDVAATYANYVKAHADKCAEVVALSNDFFLEPHELEDEDTMDHGMFCNKKTYTAHLITNEKKPYMVKGLASKRRNYPPALRQLCGRVQTLLLHEQLDQAKHHVEVFTRELANYQISLAALAISAAYKSTTSGRRLIRPFTLLKVKQRTKIQFNDGDRIAYIVRPKRDGESNYQKGEELDFALENKILPDIPQYFKDLRKPLMKILQFNFNTVAMFTLLERAMNRIQTDIQSRRMFSGGGGGGAEVSEVPMAAAEAPLGGGSSVPLTAEESIESSVPLAAEASIESSVPAAC